MEKIEKNIWCPKCETHRLHIIEGIFAKCKICGNIQSLATIIK